MYARYTVACIDGTFEKFHAETTDEIWLIKKKAKKEFKKDIIDVIDEENIEGSLDTVLLEILSSPDFTEETWDAP